MHNEVGCECRIGCLKSEVFSQIIWRGRTRTLLRKVCIYLNSVIKVIQICLNRNKRITLHRSLRGYLCTDALFSCLS